MAKPSPHQLEALRMAIRTGGILEYWRGGWWTVPGTAVARRTLEGYDVPAWFAQTNTVKSLEKAGWIRRTGRLPEAWRDDRVVTEEGERVAR